VPVGLFDLLDGRPYPGDLDVGMPAAIAKLANVCLIA
jgi:hypothetical protein